MNRPDALEENVAALFEMQAHATPNAVAIVAGQGELTTYGELAIRARQLGGWLAQHGLAPEQPVGVLMQRSAGMIAVLLAILRSGGAYVPVDPDDAAERNRLILAGAGCRLVLGDRASIAALRGSGSTEGTVFVAVEEIALAPALVAPPPCAPGGSRLAYILFTSGSTGAPKGVEIEHRSVVNLLFAARDLLGFTATDRYLAASTIGFDISVTEIFLPLIAGGSVLLRDRKIWLAPRTLAADVRRHGVTVLQTGPSVWSVALAEIPDFPKVRVAITTAEPVPPALARILTQVGAVAWNLYGPTETTVWSTAHRITDASFAGDDRAAISAPIGQPIANTTVSILDDQGAPVARGARGELCLGGLGLARGYRNNAALTRERFVTLGGTGERVYRTGDLVAWSADGELLYFGRNDDQLKIRGIRIEPREVESALLAHAGVAQAAATWFAAPAGGRAIVAAVVARTGAAPTPQQLHAWLEARLPAAMIPSRFIFLAALPLSPSGKVDRAAIRAKAASAVPAPAHSPPDSAAELTPTESALAAIWQRILGVASIGADAHFFTVGGDSLAAVRMIADAESLFRVSLPVQTVFEAPTVARLAARIDRARERAGTGGASNFIFPLAEVPGSRPVFFSNADLKLAARGVWQPPCSLYNVSHWAHGSGFVQADSVTELARLHLSALRALQPAGPYRIAGYSFGGLVAFEMARQLRQLGHVVELLFLLDPMQPYRTASAPHGYAMEDEVTPLDESWAAWFARHTGNIARRPGKILSYCGGKIRWHIRHGPLRQWVIYKLVHLHGRRPNPISAMILPKNRWPAFWYSARRMAHRYIAAPYDGLVTAVFPGESDRQRVWRELLGPHAEIQILAAPHLALFDPPAIALWMQPLAERIAAQDRAERSPNCSPSVRPVFSSRL